MTIYEPKKREIYKLPFYPDRIIHHCLMRIVEPIWERLFLNDSYACIKGRGLHAGSRRTMEFVRKYRYCLKMDIAKFYPSVDQNVLYGIVARKIKCADTLRLFREIIFSYPGGRNIPIGNYTSQWLGNLYLNEMDQWLKHRHRVKAYIRYCDDFCLFDNDKGRLHFLAAEIEAFLEERLKLRLSKNDVFPVTQGVDFLGYRHFPGRILLRKSTATRMKRRMRRLPDELASGRITPGRYRSTLASVSGWLRWANTYHLQLHLQIKQLREVVDDGRSEGATEVSRFCQRARTAGWAENKNRRDHRQGDPCPGDQDHAEQVRQDTVVLPDDTTGAERRAVCLLHRIGHPVGAGGGLPIGDAVLGNG